MTINLQYALNLCITKKYTDCQYSKIITMKKFLSLFLFSFLVFTVSAAVSSSPAPDETITILGVPSADDGNGSSILVGESSQLAAYLTARVDNVDDFVANVTSEAAWSSSSNQVARVILNGRKVLLSALSGGKTTIRCEYEGISESFDLTVVDVALEDLELSRKSAVLEEKKSVSITASLGGYQDVTASATWTSNNETVATVEAGVVTGVAEGNATITCEFQGKTATCAIYVFSTPTSGLKDGRDYYIFQMDATTFNELEAQGKVTADLRANGAIDWDAGILVPEDATRVNYKWNPAAEVADAPQVGLNSFGEMDSWFSVASVDPTPEGGWGNICGGLGIGTWEYPASSDAEVAKLQDLTPDHVLVVVLKGNYTPATSLQIAMTPTAGGDNVTLFEVTDATGRHNDGDWEVFTLTYSDLVNLGIDLSQPITAETWYPWAYMANGAGNRVDVDCVFFYIPDEGSTSINETRNSAAMNVTAKDGRVYCDEAFRIVNMAGQDVTSLNGELQGTYLVAVGGETVKINVD